MNAPAKREGAVAGKTTYLPRGSGNEDDERTSEIIAQMDSYGWSDRT
jgi:hypothetical protein